LVTVRKHEEIATAARMMLRRESRVEQAATV
jgi:hypothetical protein